MPKNKEMCIGCEDNFYNGNNPYGIKKCDRYSSARLVNVVIATMNEPPPFTRLEKCLSCYRKSGYAYLKNFDKIKKGNYKGMYCYSGDASFWENKE